MALKCLKFNLLKPAKTLTDAAESCTLVLWLPSLAVSATQWWITAQVVPFCIKFIVCTALFFWVVYWVKLQINSVKVVRHLGIQSVYVWFCKTRQWLCSVLVGRPILAYFALGLLRFFLKMIALCLYVCMMSSFLPAFCVSPNDLS